MAASGFPRSSIASRRSARTPPDSARCLPSGIFIQGLSIAGALMDGASTSAFFTNPGTSLALAFAALLIVISYTLITINFIVTLVESYLVVSVGFIFLGFGGSRWTAPYTERYIGLAVSIGIKIVLLYCLISAGFDLSLGWLDEAQAIAASARPVMTAFDVMGGALIFMMCCWQIPKLFAAVIGGSPALTGGDLVATAAVVGGAALAVGGAAVAGGALWWAEAAARRRAPDLRRAPEGRAPALRLRLRASDRLEQVRPLEEVRCRRPRSPSPGSTANGGGTRRQPDPPSNGSGDGGCGRSANRHDRSRVAIRLAERTCRAEAQRRRRLHRFRQLCRRLEASRWRVLGSRPNRFSGASRRHRLARAMEARHLELDQDRVRLLPRLSDAAERAVTLLPAVPWKEPRSVQFAQSRQFWGRVRCCIRGQRRSRKSATAHNCEGKERAHSRC